MRIDIRIVMLTSMLTFMPLESMSDDTTHIHPIVTKGCLI